MTANPSILDSRDRAAYPIGEVAAYLRVPVSTLRLWTLGQRYATRRGEGKFARPLFDVAARRPPTLSFWNVVEAYVLTTLRRHHEVPMQTVRKALDYVERRLRVDRPLIQKVFLTDGVSLFLEEYRELVTVSAEGQLACRKLLEGSLKRVDRDLNGLALRVCPWVNSPDEPKHILIDPKRAFGKPIVSGTGIPTNIIVERFRAGDSIAHLAEDYRLTPEQVETALRWETRAAVA